MASFTQRALARVLPPLSALPSSLLLRRCEEGAVSGRAQALRALRARLSPALARDAEGLAARVLQERAPALRRAGAGLAGALASPGLAGPLMVAAAVERCDAPRLAMVVAAARCGVPRAEVIAPLLAAEARTLPTAAGPRQPARLLGPGQVPLLGLALGEPADGEGPAPSARLRASAAAALARDPEDDGALLQLAAQEHPDDLDLLLSQARGAGRRQEQRLLTALGLHGDPRSLDPLGQILRAVDVDPGAGFARRQLAAAALGALGLPDAGPLLRRALTDEALDHEGRPGAGLGIQRPVRAALLIALGECGDDAAAPALAAYLGNTTGSAQGGFYLPAMDALWRLGAVDALRGALGGPETAAANALGVLVALGRLDLVRPYLDDPRPLVAQVARGA